MGSQGENRGLIVGIIMADLRPTRVYFSLEPFAVHVRLFFIVLASLSANKDLRYNNVFSRISVFLRRMMGGGRF